MHRSIWWLHDSIKQVFKNDDWEYYFCLNHNSIVQTIESTNINSLEITIFAHLADIRYLLILSSQELFMFGEYQMKSTLIITTSLSRSISTWLPCWGLMSWRNLSTEVARIVYKLPEKKKNSINLNLLINCYITCESNIADGKQQRQNYRKDFGLVMWGERWKWEDVDHRDLAVKNETQGSHWPSY